MKVTKRWFCPNRKQWVQSTWQEHKDGGPQKNYKEKVIEDGGK